MSQLQDRRQLEAAQESAGIPAGVAREILRAIGSIGYGSVEVVIHDHQVVQIESREKQRIAPTQKPPG